MLACLRPYDASETVGWEALEAEGAKDAMVDVLNALEPTPQTVGGDAVAAALQDEVASANAGFEKVRSELNGEAVQVDIRLTLG